ncbi:hypothetical protein ACFPIJ_56445 [Dactylosporangium cerinum]|uniref:Uncharacterized protein n=1 Tax=Dactylosporangium cerinum TaxID=1434730 RepID=A0ABV9WIN7_9ACTN
MSELIFPLDDVLGLAEHALAAPSHTAPVGNRPPGPALLLLTTDDGNCLLSNGLPQLDAAPGQPHICGLRAVYAENATHGVTGPTRTPRPPPATC